MNIVETRFDSLELPTRVLNSLKDNDINIIDDILLKTEGELLRFPNFGRKSLRELKIVLSGFNIGIVEGAFDFFDNSETQTYIKKRESVYIPRDKVASILTKHLQEVSAMPTNAGEVNVLWNSEQVEVIWWKRVQL